MPHAKPATNEVYVQKGGNCCPFCGESNDITGGQVEIDVGMASQPVSCGDCDKEWTDTYVLTGYIE